MKRVKPIYVFESITTSLARAYVDRVLTTGWMGLGRETEMFEKQFADYTEAEYVIGTNSATSALHIILELIGVKDKIVITTPMTFVSTNAAILYAGGIPVFADVNPETMLISVDSVMKLKNKYSNIAAVMNVGYGGNLLSKAAINNIEMELDVPVVNDFAHAAGSLYTDGKKAGSFGGYNVFSFHAVKNLASPDGGAIVTNDALINDGAKQLRWMGIDKSTYIRSNNNEYDYDYDVKRLGYKYHMNDVAAAICRAHLMVLDSDNVRRREIANKYINNIESNFIYQDTVLSSNHLTVMVLNKLNTNEFINIMKRDYNIYLSRHYYPNDHYDLFKKYDSYCYNCDMMYDRIVTLPNHMRLEDGDVDYVIDSINEVLQ